MNIICIKASIPYINNLVSVCAKLRHINSLFKFASHSNTYVNIMMQKEQYFCWMYKKDWKEDEKRRWTWKRLGQPKYNDARNNDWNCQSVFIIVWNGFIASISSEKQNSMLLLADFEIVCKKITGDIITDLIT